MAGLSAPADCMIDARRPRAPYDWKGLGRPIGPAARAGSDLRLSDLRQPAPKNRRALRERVAFRTPVGDNARCCRYSRLLILATLGGNHFMTRLRMAALLAAAAFAWPAGLFRRRPLRRQGPAQDRRRSSCPSPPRSSRSPSQPDKIALQRRRRRPATRRHRRPRRRPAAGPHRRRQVRASPTRKVARVTHGRPRHAAGQRRHRDHRHLRRQDGQGRRHGRASCDVNLPINFGNQIVPIFTKLGCNSGGCHGKASGQNGFKLSLLGFEPEVDYTALVKEARGRRALPRRSRTAACCCSRRPAPWPTAAASAWRSAPTSTSSIRRWIAAGTPFGKPTDPVVTKITRLPRAPHPDPATTSSSSPSTPTTATARVEDVTRRAQYESNDHGDRRRRRRRPGPHAGHERRGGHHGPLPGPRRHLPRHRAAGRARSPTTRSSRRRSSISTRRKKWQATRPRAVGTVHRRAVHPPRVARHDRHAADAGAGARRSSPTRTRSKRDKLIDALLEIAGVQLLLRQQVGRHPARQAARPAGPGRAAPSRFHDWIREAIASDKPYDEFARDILAATGDEIEQPADGLVQGTAASRAVRGRHGPGVPRPAAGLRPVPSPSLREVEPGRLLGPGRLLRPRRPQERRRCPAASRTSRTAAQVIFNRVDRQRASTSAPARPAVMKPLDGEPMKVGADDDPRQKLVDWMVDAEEPVLRPGRGQPLLGALLRPRHRRSARRHARHQPADATPNCSTPWPRTWSTTSTASSTWSRRSARAGPISSARRPTSSTSTTSRTYARYYPQRMAAEVLFDAVCQVTDSPATFGGLPQDKHAPKRAIMLPDESFPSYFLDVFGRPQRISACECERVSEANLAQALHLLNSRRGAGQAGARRRPGRPAGQGPAAGRREGRGAVPVGLRPQADARSSCELALAHIAKHAAEQEDRLREHPLGAAQHEGVRVQPVRSADSTMTPAGAPAQAPRPASFHV